MGLLGMARRAGAARGAYMAEMENYHRQRQGMLDQRQAMLDQSLLDFRRQQMGIAAAGERRAQATFDSNQGWLAKERANKEKTWGQEDVKRKDEEAKRKVDLNIAQEKLNAAKNAQARRSEIWGLMSDDEKIAAVYPYSRYAVDGTMGPMRQMGRMGRGAGANRYGENGENGEYGGRGNRSGGRGPGVAAAAKPAVSDTLLKANAEAVTPDRMQMAFGQQFYDTDDNILKKTGMKRDQFIRTLADQYRAHILSARENAMNIDDFISQAAGRYGFVDRDDLSGLLNARLDKRIYGLDAYGSGHWTKESLYARRNPAFYKQRRALIDEVFAIEGLKPETVNYALRNPEFVRKYRKARERLSPSIAFQAVSEAFRNRAGMQQASSNGAQSERPSAPVPTRLPFSDDSELTGLPSLSVYERLRMHRSDRYIGWYNQAQNNGYDRNRARRYAEYQYRRGAR